MDVFLVVFPSQGVVDDVFPDAGQIPFAADDVVVEGFLPLKTPVTIQTFIDPAR